MNNFIIRICFVSLWSLFPYLFCIQNLDAADWYQPDNFQVRTFYGRTTWPTVGPGPNDDYTWVNISICAEKSVFSWMEIIAGLGPGYLKSDNFGSSLSAELRLIGHAHYGIFYFELGGGLAYLFDRDNLPDLADSDLYGLISASVGIEIFRSEGERHKLFCKTGYRIEHISSPFHFSEDGDVGLNLGAIEVIFGWRF
jgi:hypothetical protein